MRYSVRMALWIGFGLVTGLFLLATVVTVWSVDQVLAIEQELAMLDYAKHHGHLTLADIQEQYIHQAHTIILGDKSHLKHYDAAQQATRDRIRQLTTACRLIGVTEGIDDIRNTSEQVDSYFRETVLEGIDQSNVTAKHEYHNELERFATRARFQILNLNASLEKRSSLTRQKHERFLAYTRRITMIALLLALIMAIAVGVTITRMISGPINRLHEAFGRIGAGDMEARVSPEGPRELKELSSGFNQMADDLADINSRIAINERMAVMGEVAAGVAHELNNPLAVITGYLKLARKATSDEMVGKDLDVIRDEIKNCKEIVQGLLELARPGKLERRSLDVVALVKDTVDRLSTARPEPKADIHMESSAPTAYVFADETAVRRVMNNLLGNALDAAGENGSIKVVIKEGTESIIVSVSDSGPGIALNFREDLFKPFKTTKQHGTGLGLAISHAIVKNHEGRIEVDKGPLGGARFSVSLPVAEPEKNQSEKT